ncbi:MAG TPA: hypothetical protein VMC09_15720 [Anaerolineales bacterium]|nr:hypothetical protein [Anaerolineales bacterium]
MDKIVECHSGFAYAERPMALTWESRRLEIVRILAEWRTPGQKHFRVRTTDGMEFSLVYSEINDEWQVEQP